MGGCCREGALAWVAVVERLHCIKFHEFLLASLD